MNYGQNFYEKQRAGSLSSAKAVVPVIVDQVAPHSVVDVGCGLGTWLTVFRELGVSDVLGLDGDYVPQDMRMIPPEQFKSVDLSKPVSLARAFDLAISIEVGEHLPESAAETFVESLTRMAPVVVFAAAVPLQGGTNHVNEQWPAYWARLFGKHGCVTVDAIRPQIWNNDRVEPFYRQNLLVFVKESALQKYPLLEQSRHSTRDEMLSVVHPKVFIGRNSYPLAPVSHLAAWTLRLACGRLKQWFSAR